ncbi:MAG: site-specific integrase [Clostridia bacterium]|nr:site-specific integrase [Clostridia bacterium]
MKAKKLPSGSYRVRLSVGKDPKTDKYVYKSFTADTAKEAERLAYEWLYSKEKMDISLNLITLAKAMEEFNESRKYTLSPRTAKEYECYRKSAYKDIENFTLAELNQKVIQMWVNKLSATQSPKTVKNKYAYLTALLNSYDIQIKCTLPKKRPTEYHVVTKEELSEILKEAGLSPIGLAIRLAVFVPARRSEICAINPKTDIKGNLLTINKAKVKDESNQWVIKDTKTYKSTRTVEMPPDIIAMLKAFPIEPNPDTLYKDFKKIVKKLGFSDMRFHDLRHYGATMLMDALVPSKEVMHRGGWANLNTLMNIYVHYNPDTAKVAAQATNNIYNSFME